MQRRITEDDVMEEKQIRDLFRQKAGEDLELDAYELKGLLNGHDRFRKGDISFNFIILILFYFCVAIIIIEVIQSRRVIKCKKNI